MRLIAFTMSVAIAASGGAALAADKPQPTDPMSSSRAPDPKPKSGNSTFDAPDKPAGPWGEIPGGGGPSGYNDGSGQQAPQYEGEKFKSAQQSERDTIEKPGGKQAAEAAKSKTPLQPSSSQRQGQAPVTDVSPDEVLRKHHETNSPGHLGPQGGSTADSGKAKQDAEAHLEQEAAKTQGSY